MDIETTGFSPAPDEIVKLYGPACAVVFGKIWRYCQMREGKCRASIETICTELGMSRNTVHGHIQTLLENEYIRDLTPENNGLPHEYIDNGRFKMRLTVERATSQPPQFLTTTSSKTEEVPPQKLRSTSSKIEDKDSIKIQPKKEEEKTSTATGDFLKSEPAKIYESNFGALTPMLTEEIMAAVSKHGEAVVLHGLQQALRANVRRWSYAAAVIERAAQNGYRTEGNKPKQKPLPNKANWSTTR